MLDEDHIRRDERHRIADKMDNTAKTIRDMAQRFVADTMQGQLALVRAEALEEFATSLRHEKTKQDR